MDSLVKYICILSLCVHHGVLYLESELGLDNQAIVKDGDKLLLMLNPEFSDIDQETLNKLRKLLVN